MAADSLFGQAARVACALLLGSATAAVAQDAPPPLPRAFAASVGDAPPIGRGPLLAYRTKERVLLSVPLPLLDRLFFWYVEAARFPPTAIAVQGNSVAEAVVTLERQGSRLLVRDRSPAFSKRSPSGVPAGDGVEVDPRRASAPIERAIDAAALGPVVVALPIIAEGEGRLLVDITDAFSTDIDGLTATHHIASAGLVPAPIPITVDPARSFIADVDVYPDNLHVRSHLTFRAQDPGDPIAGFKPVSIELGHSLIVLPQRPMAARRYDDRVGFMPIFFTEFEAGDGSAASGPLRGLIKRHRLEKKDPSAAVSDPVKPIVFYIGRGVPERWRGALKRGVESWEPVFRAAGFSNAIIARDAPSEAEDPDWSPEDARYNVIRWVAQPHINAMGPSVADPRSGEILFAHILVWPQVLEYFSRYYWMSARGLDPGIDRLPLSEDKQVELMTYIVAHEVGHSIGLRHNHLASTAYSVKQLRDPAFANVHGPNASIMAYGRFNQAAQPGDGVTRVMAGVQGPWDYFAIQWGYGVHGSTPAEEQAALDRLAAEAAADPFKRWGAGEDGFEEPWIVDPRVQMENTGAERVEATRLGLRNVARAVGALGEAAPDNDTYRATWSQALGRYDTMIASTLKLVGGQLAPSTRQAPTLPVDAATQREAVVFLVDEAPAAYEVFLQPGAVARGDPVGGGLLVEKHRAQWVAALLAGPKLAQVKAQESVAPDAYRQAEYLDDITRRVWGDFAAQPAWRIAQQRAWLDAAARVLDPQPDPNAARAAALLAGQMFSPGYIAVQLSDGSDTLFPGHVREVLPGIRERLRRAADRERDLARKSELEQLAARIDVLLAPRKG
ncbi:MAG: zinc-dependent metalloprotease [Xanthomonadaceae bacterium]|jgi:hypothetical protein|nr:zinc-dependent metalloprotease [Xanthomonadaceae bacterium]